MILHCLVWNSCSHLMRSERQRYNVDNLVKNASYQHFFIILVAGMNIFL